MRVMKNDLFNQTLMRKYSKNFKLTPSKHGLILKHIEKLEEGQFEAETKNYIYFYEIWLKGILGYNLDENILIDEKEEEGRGKSEFILKSGDKKFMVVELKDQKTDLDKPQNRANDKRTPVDQAFDYAQHTGDIDWILVSNYKEFRLYNWHKKGQYISFNATELLDKTFFAYFMLSFSKKSYIDMSLIDSLLDKTVVIERELEKEFYKLYNETRLMLIKEFEEFNGCSRTDAIHYAQMIMNRYMFICFAEDIDILPSQISTDTILTPILKGNLRHGSIWQRLNELFLDINEGNEYKNISEYNGGIFKKNLDHIKIRDIINDQKFFNDVYQDWKFEEYEKEINSNLGPYGQKVNPIYRNMLTISTFDFSTELDVNILGHIFENSIGDIEELKEGTKGRRKKEGIFYTPDYITDYICRNTIIPYLSKSGKANTINELIGEYLGSKIAELDLKVKEIKIIDPACGSGAFLNKAANVLLEIHEAIREQLYTKDTLDHVWDPIEERREILLNNIYGVDLNEESVEITKLSLFLKVCRKGLKLPNLDTNIQCGNSVVNDRDLAGDKYLNWNNSFPDVFNNGGFDIVLGNPPYGVFTKKEKNYFRKVEKIQFKSGDSAEIFCKKCFDELLKPEGILGFIIPKKSLYGEPWESLRVDYWKQYDLMFILDTSKSFADVLLEASAYGLKKSNHDSKVRLSCLNENNIIKEFSYSNKDSIFLRNNTIQIYKMAYEGLFDKISSKCDYEKVKVHMGTYIPKKFFTDQPTENKLLKGIDIGKWQIKTNRYLKKSDEVNWESAKKFLKPKVIFKG
jgi:type I restriction-modification system DNA methylase subunit